MRKSSDALLQWLALTWDRPERSYNPDLREFLASVLDYPKKNVITEDKAAGGYPDLKLISPEGSAWVVGDMKKEDSHLTNALLRTALWQEKRKYVDGLTRFVLFVTQHYLWVVDPTGEPVAGFETALDLRAVNLEELKVRLAFLNYEAAAHTRQWQEFIAGTFPYIYLKLNDPDTLKQLRGDLRAGFQELTEAATHAITELEIEYKEYERHRAEIEQNLVGQRDTQRRARVRLQLEYEFVRCLFGEALPQFQEQYGRDIEATNAQEQEKRVREAFIADSAAALIARVLFLRLVEDLGLTQKRRLSNGGPSNWATFVEQLTGDARALVRVASDDVARIYKEPFERTLFDWIQRANGQLDQPLQRLILRLNAYDFADLSEEILGDIYQQFLPPQKRKRLGEYYTPASIVDWILDRTVRTHGLGTILDPACGSGSFLVRYAHWRLEDARQRHLVSAAVRGEVEAEVWGFDVNPFAAFISLFQLTWALLRFYKGVPPPHVHVYNENSLLRDSDIVQFLGEEHIPPGVKARDEQKWRYVVGNPPYIRAERIKYGAEMREFWSQVWGQNADTGLVFLYRALTEWLEPGGYLGMVVSGGYATSETAGKIWRLLQPGQVAALRSIVWLEFVGKVWDPNVIPMLLLIERVPAQEDDEIELCVPAVWPDSESVIKVRYGDFFDKSVNPNGSNGVARWGEYLLPLLQPGDVPILRKLYPSGNGLTTLSPEIVEWTYGIQRGGVDVTEVPVGSKPIQVVAGRSLAVAWPGEPVGWIDLDAVEQRPYGKLSLWKEGRYPVKFIAIATIGLAPFAAVVESSQGTLASLNTTILAENYSRKPEAIVAYLNSKLVRFYWAIRLRSAVLSGSSRATFYPRTFEALPWPKALTPPVEQQLSEGYDLLAQLAVRAKDSPNEWLLAEAERRIATAHIRITDPVLGLRFEEETLEARADELRLEGNRIESSLSTFASFKEDDVTEYVYRILALTSEEDTMLKAQDVQKLVVPQDYAALIAEYRQRMTAFERVEQDFRAALESVDAIVYALFGITEQEQETIEARLASFPLNRLQPRYPWETVRPRPIKAYMQDRFA
jgi:hypothetical protein